MPRKSAATLAAEAEAKAAAEAAAAEAAANDALPADGGVVPPGEDAPPADAGDVPPHDPPAQGLADALGAPDFVPDPTPSNDTDIPAAPEVAREPGDHVGEYVGHGAEFVSLADGSEWHCDPETGLITAKA